jgi:phosphatidylserine/phosphatidylglycerophosphate/cardiolipin synthase-like enzyme
VSKEGAAAKSMCLGSGDSLMDDYYFTLTKAKTHLEISSLTFPSGNFRKVLVNALSLLSHRQTSPTIRMIFSSLDGITPNFLNKPDKVLDALLKDVAAVGGNTANLKINLAYLSDKKVSWNHAKIVLADSYYVLQGGHNFLDPDYVKESPIFDLSMHASGSVGYGVQKFVNALWAHANPVASNLKNDERIVPPFSKDPSEGRARVIGMGRLGSFGDQPSDDGFTALLNASKKSIYFAQQDMFNDIVKLGAKPSLSLPALINALYRGVSVKVAQSSSTKFLGYGMIAPEKALSLLLEAATKEGEARKFVPEGGISIREYLCRHIEYAPMLFNSAITIWPNGEQIGVHPKLIIADEVSFYLGSQNFYPSDLQEFGLLVSDTKTTKELIANYWAPIWEESQKKKVECK